VVCDWRTDAQLNLRQSQILSAVFGLAAIALAITFYFSGGRVFPLIMKIAGTFLGLLLGVFVLGLVVKRANSTSATCGLAAGIACLALAFFYNVAHWWYGAIASLPVFLVGCLASFVNPRPVKADAQ
jgi:Na+/proline symporter